MTIDRKTKSSKVLPVIDLSGAEGKLCIVAALGLFYTAAWISVDSPGRSHVAATPPDPDPPGSTMPAAIRPPAGTLTRQRRSTRPIRIRTRSS